MVHKCCYSFSSWISAWLLVSTISSGSTHTAWASSQTDLNLAVNKTSLQSSTLWSYDPGLAVDSDPDTCSVTPRSSEQRWWQVHLGDPAIIHSVSVTITPGSYQRFTIFVIDYDRDNRTTFVKCNSFEGKFKEDTIKLLCAGDGIEGYKVYIRDDRRGIDQLRLCEVQVFGSREGYVPKSCASLSLKNGQVLTGKDPLDGTKTAVFQCKPGHILWGQRLPSCQPITCGDPPPSKSIGDNQWKLIRLSAQSEPPKPDLFESPDEAWVRGQFSGVGDVAHYTCEDGYSLVRVPEVEEESYNEDGADWYRNDQYDFDEDLLLEKVEAVCSEKGQWAFSMRFKCVNETIVLAAISDAPSMSSLVPWEYLIYLVLIVLLLLVLSCLWCGLVKANARRRERNLKTLVTHPRIVEPSIASSTSSTRFLFPDFKAKDLQHASPSLSGASPEDSASDDHGNHFVSSTTTSHPSQNGSELLTHLPLPNGHYLTTTQQVSQQPILTVIPTNEDLAHNSSQDTMSLSASAAAAVASGTAPSAALGLPVSLSTFKPAHIHPHSRHLAFVNKQHALSEPRLQQPESLPSNWSLRAKHMTLTNELLVDDVDPTGVDQTDKAAAEEQLFSVPTSSYNTRMVQEAIKEQLMSHQPQYTNVEEALQLHQELLKQAGKLPLVDEAGYASLVVPQSKINAANAEPNYQEIGQGAINSQNSALKVSQPAPEPNYQEIGPAKPKRQLRLSESRDDPADSANLSLYQNAAVTEYPDLLQRSPEACTRVENPYVNEAAKELEDEDLMYAKVDLVKKQKSRKSSSEGSEATASPSQEALKEQVDARFNNYFATGLRDSERVEDFRVSHC